MSWFGSQNEQNETIKDETQKQQNETIEGEKTEKNTIEYKRFNHPDENIVDTLEDGYYDIVFTPLKISDEINSS